MRTVYVVGAGASFEINLPIGNELKSEIAESLGWRFDSDTLESGSKTIYRSLSLHCHNKMLNIGKYISACQHIHENMPLAISIDNFIDSKRDNEEIALCGKLAIIERILRAERRSKICLESSGGNSREKIEFHLLEQTWYLQFFRTITENCKYDDLHDRFKKITLIIFNYDRCIEHFLFHSLKSYYELSDQGASEIISHLTIFHPYGVVGQLPWQKYTKHAPVRYGGEIKPEDLIHHTETIRTFTEGAHSHIINGLRSSMEKTERLVFLGFAFHRLNMKLLSLDGTDRYKNTTMIQCYATAFGSSKSDQKSIENSIRNMFENDLHISIEDMKCAQIFKDYSRSLGYS